MNKVYTRINWENYPSEKTAVNESNLNKMDYALDEIDKRVVEYDTTKANVASLNELIVDWHIDETTGVITIYKVSGEQIIFDLNLEKVPVGFSMTDDGILIMTTDDGTEFTANIGSMIPVFTFEDSAEIAFEVISKSQEKIEVENEVFFSAESAEGTVYASSSYTTYSHEPYKAFDNNGTTAWICDATYDANGQYLAYNFGQNVYPTSIDLTYRSQESNLSFIVQGCVEKEFSENNIWEDLTEEVSFEASASSQISLEITKDTPYKMYRLYLTGGDVNAYSYAIISELKIHGYKYANNAGEKIIKASIKTGSITENKLQPNFLADCRLYAGNAENSATLAGEYAEQAKESAESISNNAVDIVFDDTNAQLGSDDVQGAIESIEKSLIKNQNFGIDGMPVGKLLDGRTVYMAYGSQPITMTASESFEPYIIEHGITDIKHILSFELIMISGSTGYKLPYFTNGALHTVLTYIDTESFCIDNRTSAWTDYTARYTMYYTKE